MEEFLSEGVRISYVVFEPRDQIVMSRSCLFMVLHRPML